MYLHMSLCDCVSLTVSAFKRVCVCLSDSVCLSWGCVDRCVSVHMHLCASLDWHASLETCLRVRMPLWVCVG